MQYSNTEQFRVLATCAYFEPGYRGGGPIRSMARLVDTVPDRIDLALLTLDRDLGDDRPYPGLSGRWSGRGRSAVFYLDALALGHWLSLFRRLRHEPIDLLYVNSLFSPIFSLVPIIAARVRLIPARQILIAPRGELAESALSLKPARKRHFLKVWLRFLRNLPVVWHATSTMEAADIRATHPNAAIEVCLDQGDLPPTPRPRTAPDDTVRFVFISRISRMKNLDLILTALCALEVPAIFDIYGPIEDATYWAECQSLIALIPPNVEVRYRGELVHSEVQATFSRYDAFLLPSKGESFGHVIAESLSASCPVICSDRTPWTSVLDDGGGVALRTLTASEVRTEIAEIASASRADRTRLSEAAAKAYLDWRSKAEGPHILEQVRTRSR